MQSDVLHCDLWSVRLYNIFLHYLINDTIFGKLIEHKMCVLITLQVLSETFLILRTVKRDTVINVYRS